MSECYPHSNQKEETRWKATKTWRKGSRKDDNKKKIHLGVRLQESVCPTEAQQMLLLSELSSSKRSRSWRWRRRTTSRRIN
jgi:hypothetical protein